MLNARNVRIGSRQEDAHDTSGDTPRLTTTSLSKSTTGVSPHSTKEPSRGRFRISLRDIVATSVALKSGMDIEIDGGESQVTWPDLLFLGPPNSPGKRSVPLTPEGASVKSSPGQDEEIPDHVAEAISALQRKLILMNNELNCELWLARRNVEHICRLKKECELAKSAEGERQGLVSSLSKTPESHSQYRTRQHNKLREYKSEVARLQKELKDHKEQAFSMKNKYAQWNAELQAKLRDFREHKRSWTIEIASLQASDAQHRVRSETHRSAQFVENSAIRQHSRLKGNYLGMRTGKSSNSKRGSRRLRTKSTGSGITRGKSNSLYKCRNFGGLNLLWYIQPWTHAIVGKWTHTSSTNRRSYWTRCRATTKG